MQMKPNTQTNHRRQVTGKLLGWRQLLVFRGLLEPPNNLDTLDVPGNSLAPVTLDISQNMYHLLSNLVSKNALVLQSHLALRTLGLVDTLGLLDTIKVFLYLDISANNAAIFPDTLDNHRGRWDNNLD